MKKEKIRYIPASYQLIVSSPDPQVEVYGAELNGAVYAMLYGGKRSKPDWHYRFKNIEDRDAQIKRSLEGIVASNRLKAEYKAAKAGPHNVKVGDIFKSSWGYDQTNIDYYEVVRLVGKSSAAIRAVAQESNEDAFMQGTCVPLPGEYIGEEMVKRISMYRDQPSIKVDGYRSAYRVEPELLGGVKVYPSARWTAYA